MSVKIKDKIKKDIDAISSIKNLYYNSSLDGFFFLKINPIFKKNTYMKTIYNYKNGEVQKIYKLKKNEKFLGFFGCKCIISKKTKNKYKVYSVDLQDINDKKLIYKDEKELNKIIYLDEKNLIFLSSKKTKNTFNNIEIDRVNFWKNGNGYIDSISYIYRYDILNDEIIKISKDSEDIDFVFYDKIKKSILFTSKSDGDIYTPYSKAYCYYIDYDKIDILYDKNDFDFEGLFYFDDRFVAMGSYNTEYGINENPSFYELSDNNLSLYCKNIFSVDNSVNTDCRHYGKDIYKVHNNKLYFLSTKEDKCSIYSLCDGEVSLDYDKITSVEDFEFINDYILVSGFDRNLLQEIYMFRDNQNIKLTSLNDEYTYNIDTIEYKYLEKSQKGYILFPENYIEGKMYPAVFQIHGGPKTTYSSIFSYEFYLLSKMGYIVFFANPFGSDNYDNDYADIRGEYGKKDYDNLMKFCDVVIDKYPQIDKNNIAVSGGSYGGFMVNWITSHCNRFKSAITQRCISNWVSFYATSDIGFYFSKDQLHCEEFSYEKFWEYSPLKHVKKVSTPTLVLHSEDDYRCPLEQGIQWFVHLKLNKVKTKMVIFKGENHDLSRSGGIKNRVDRLGYIIDWLEKTLKNKGV